MRFDVEVDFATVTVEVLHYNPGADMIQTGMGMGDCIEPEDEELEVEILSHNGGADLLDQEIDALYDKVLDIMRQPEDYDA